MKTKAMPLISPVVEPMRCLLTCPDRDMSLSCSAKKGVGTSPSFSRRNIRIPQSCEFSIIPLEHEKEGLVVLRSLETQSNLSIVEDTDGKLNIETCEKSSGEENDGVSDEEMWHLEQSSEKGAGINLIPATKKESKLVCNANGELYLSQNIYPCMGESWSIEFLSGELCFLSSPTLDIRVRCDPTGFLSGTKNWRGWEVFRFIEAGDGSVYISSWTHGHYLSSLASGRVLSTKKRSANEKWIISKSESGDGVTILSKAHNRALTMKENRLITVSRPSTQWDLVAAHRDGFFVSSVASKKHIGSIPVKRSGPSDAVMTNKRQAWERWTIQGIEDGFVTLRSNAHGLYLGVNKTSKVTLSNSAGPDEMWSIEEAPTNDGVFLVSERHRVLLSCDEDGNLKAITGQIGTNETWRFEPSLPSSVSGRFIGMIVGASVVTATFAAATPFLITGTLAAIGFQSAGVASGSIAASMMSAEAVSAGGGVAAGGLVATCQSVGAAGLGVLGTSTAMASGAILGGSVSAATVAGISKRKKKDASNDVSSIANEEESQESSTVFTPTVNRPFCGWRSW